MAKRKLGGLGKGLDSLFEDLPMTEDASPDLTRLPVREIEPDPDQPRKNFDEDEIELFRKVYAEGVADGEFDLDNVDLVADITHYCIKGLEVPFIYGRLGHGLTEESSKPLVAKVVYGALGKRGVIK